MHNHRQVDLYISMYCTSHYTGAFLIPYFLMLVIEGYPMYYLELAVGQKIRKGTIGVWSHINPYLGGVGFASNMVSHFGNIGPTFKR